MKSLFRKHGYLYASTILFAISMTAIAGCTQAPAKTKDCPPAKECPQTEVIIRGSVQSTGSDSMPGS